MTSLLHRPTIASSSSPRSSRNKYGVNPVQVIDAQPGRYQVLEVARAYSDLGQRPIPLCDARHRFVSVQHTEHCLTPGKAPLERDYPRFATTVPTDEELARMFTRHRGNLGGVVPEGKVVIDIDPRSGGLESIADLTEQYGPLPDTPTVRTGGNGLHNHFRLPPDVVVPSGGSLADSGFPGVEWKGPGQQVVLPPSVHASGRYYHWEPGFALGEVPMATIPPWLLEPILKLGNHSQGGKEPKPQAGNVKYQVQPQRVQEHFASLWHQVGLEMHPGDSDRFYSCPFHQEQHPSMHIDAQRCIWNCLSPACQGHRGGGVRELEAIAGPQPSGRLPTGLVFHRPVDPDHSDTGDPSESGGNSYPNADAADADPLLEELKTRARNLFPLPEGVQPKVISRLCAFTEDPSRAIRHQVISNTWNNAANRALKRRSLYVHLLHLLSVAEVQSLWGISISSEDWSPSKREALAAQVQRRHGNYAAFDNRQVAGYVRFLTDVQLPDAEPVEDIDVAVLEALRDVDMPEDADQQRVHLVWLSRGWALPAHESKGTVRTIAWKQDVDPVDDSVEAAQARQVGLETWSGPPSDDLEQWGSPRYFAVPQERVAALGPERAFDELMELAAKLGYQPVRDVRSQLFPLKEPPVTAA